MGKYAGFSSVQLTKPRRSHFDLSHEKRLTTLMGRLTPILVQECIPSDTFRGASEVLLRLAPLLAPIFDRIKVYVHYFFVPNRLLWSEWETFITGGRLGVGIDPVAAPVPPHFDIGEVMNGYPSLLAKSSLMDYLGAPIFASIDPTPVNWELRTCDLMPVLAYNLIWYEYYRDRNFDEDDSFTVNMPVPSGKMDPDEAAEYLSTRTRMYEHDYFTSALPFTQRGEEVLMPVQLGGNAPLYGHPPTPGATTLTLDGTTQPGAISNGLLVDIDYTLPVTPSELWVKGEDFDGTSTSINDFRSAYALQVWLERNAIGGSRYNESTQAHFGVKPQDSRLQRPEYIGGGLINVQISEVVSTAWANDGAADIPQANLAGRGISYGNTNDFSYFCTEHGFIMGILSIINPPSYQQGLPRMFKRRSFLDYPWPTFAKLGEQPVNDYEIYATPASLLEDADGEFPLFGYQSRYADWKYTCSTNHSEFRDTLLFWTLTRVFEDAPVLGVGFNQFDEAIQARIFATNDTENFWIYLHNNVHVKRPLPYFGTPNTLGFS